ncbi:hypothetical protein [Larkinella terrae]|uniref:Uncharacterized protein n=1 Tax=Larkinella terrae TaxID=2025311 RepID=A0A7K0EH44_9BACT|nr:hypothetical protein [Larkinella terrae]MRS61179.1 hypothetical protein [Larkinella terrae]
MATPLTNYTVEMEHTGLSGWISYRESMVTLRFAYERMLTSIYVFIPGDEQWSAYCRSSGAKTATPRRSEIIHRLVTELRNQQAPSMVQINEFGIEIVF